MKQRAWLVLPIHSETGGRSDAFSKAPVLAYQRPAAERRGAPARICTLCLLTALTGAGSWSDKAMDIPSVLPDVLFLKGLRPG